LCQRGYFEFVKYTDSDCTTAFDLYYQAISTAPGFALPHTFTGRWYRAQIIARRSGSVPTDLQAGLEKLVELGLPRE
jgi:adenylate cyclase